MYAPTYLEGIHCHPGSAAVRVVRLCLNCNDEPRRDGTVTYGLMKALGTASVPIAFQNMWAPMSEVREWMLGGM